MEPDRERFSSWMFAPASGKCGYELYRPGEKEAMEKEAKERKERWEKMKEHNELTTKFRESQQRLPDRIERGPVRSGCVECPKCGASVSDEFLRGCGKVQFCSVCLKNF